MKKLLSALGIVFLAACSHAQTGGFIKHVRTNNKLAFFASSLGQDRLGSYKLGYLDSNVLLTVVDSVDNDYTIQLSKYHSAYIHKEDVTQDTSTHAMPDYITNNWHVKGGTTAYDTLSISMPEQLPYKSWMEINPSKIMIELYGVQSNTNWITQTTAVKEIKNVYFNQTEDDVVRITVELKHQQQWGYTVKYDNGHLLLLVKKQPTLLVLQSLKIAIDAGHGGTNNGTDGIKDGELEKNYTLLFAKEIEKYLHAKGVKHVLMTRTNDTTFGNEDRVLWLQQQQPDLLISLHLNSSNDTETNGSSTYYKYIGYRPLSTALLKQMTAIGMKEFSNVGNFNFLLNTPTDFPNTLLEIGFLSSPRDEKKIVSKKFQQLVAKQVYLGLIDFINGAK